MRDDGVRLPGMRRGALRERAEREGVEIPQALADQLAKLAS
jgi:(2R)-3-sulfolactate dehydrogenase (NADP+)